MPSVAIDVRLPLHGGQTPGTQVVRFPLHRWIEAPATQLGRDSHYTGGKTSVTQAVRLPLHRWSDFRYTGDQKLPLYM